MKEVFTIIIMSVSIQTGEPDFINTGIYYKSKTECLLKSGEVMKVYESLSVNLPKRYQVGCIKNNMLN